MIDIITHGSPCQDFSVAGKGKGGEKNSGTRSSLLWCTVNIVKEVMPKYIVWENVKNVLSYTHSGVFYDYVAELQRTGYNSYYKVLNSKDYGIPQNRERVFCISIREDIDAYMGFDGLFPWPEPFDNGIRLKHLLEPYVDEKYYLSEEKTAKLVMQLKGEGGMTINRNTAVTPMNGETSLCLPATYYKGLDNHGDRTGIAIKEATQQGYTLAQPYDGVNIGMPDSETRRGRVGVGGYSHTLQTACDQGVLEPTIIDDQGRTTKQLTRTENCPTLRAQDHGNPPKVIEDFYQSRPPRVFDECPTLRSERMGLMITEPNEIDLIGNVFQSGGQAGKTYTANGISPCVSGQRVNSQGYFVEPNECHMLGRIDIKGMDCVKRVYSEDGISPALTTMGGGHQEPKTMQNFRIRKLTPLETWRLQGQPDENFWKAKNAGISDSQLYKQAGNSITVDVLYHIFKGLFAPHEKLTLLDLFAGIGAFHEGLKRVGCDVELVAYCEIDKYASKSYSAIHGVPESMNLWDVTRILPDGLLTGESKPYEKTSEYN